MRGGALSVYAALNIHTTLQYIGVLGVLLTTGNEALSYDSPQDAKGAVSGAQKALSKLGYIKPPAIKAPPLPSLLKMTQAGGQAISSSSRAACDSRSHERQQCSAQLPACCSCSASSTC